MINDYEDDGSFTDLVISKRGPLSDYLEKFFGHSAFRSRQEEAIQTVLAGSDALVVMPTGEGKSLCYQLPALLLQGVTLVVSPLIALMKDQVDALQGKNIPATFINSSLTASEMSQRLREVRAGRYKLVYVAPERFRSESFMSALKQIEVSLLVVDEAHCVSQWGHDFRIDYLKIKDVRAAAQARQMLALTATATEEVRSDITEQLGLQEPKLIIAGFERKNLFIEVLHIRTEREKIQYIQSVLRTNPGSGIIYAATRKKAEEITALLQESGRSVLLYHAGMNDAARVKAQDTFMAQPDAVVVATLAFGMGIDKPDIRFVVHYNFPRTIEGYYQEIGRAGRDGKEARCTLLFNYGDMRIQEFFIEGNNPERSDIEEVWRRVDRHRDDETITPERLHSYFGAGKRPIEINSMLRILEKYGYISFSAAPGEEGNIRVLRPGARLSDLPFDALTRKRDREYRKLRQVVTFAYSQGCRHQEILDYFGDPEPIVGCRMCDNCTRSHAPAQINSSEEKVIIQKVLSCIARMKGRFGKIKVAQVLKGSRSQEISRYGLDQLSTFGILSEYTQDQLLKIIDAVIQHGCAQVVDMEYPKVALTEIGREVMVGGRESAVSLAFIKPKVTAAQTPEEPTSETYDLALFERLRQLRRKLAKQEGLPPYCVFSDTTLRQLAGLAPKSQEEFLRVYGIGAIKYEKYGAQFGQEIAAYLQEHGALRLTVAPAPPQPAAGQKPGLTHEITLQGIQQGLSLEEIAQRRSLTLGTIQSHVTKLIESGQKLSLAAILSEEKYQRIRAAIQQVGIGRLTPIKQVLPDEISFEEIRMVMTEMKSQGPE
jgi:ATP-dependent DNA helicase RecQ